MTALVEKVRNAIFAEGARQYGKTPSVETARYDIAKAAVLATLRAIREPTDAQIEAGEEHDHKAADWSGYSTIPADAEQHYTAMINVLIKEMEDGGRGPH